MDEDGAWSGSSAVRGGFVQAGELVWAKMAGFARWPALVQQTGASPTEHWIKWIGEPEKVNLMGQLLPKTAIHQFAANYERFVSKNLIKVRQSTLLTCACR